MPVSRNDKQYYTKEQLEQAKKVSALEYALKSGYPLVRNGTYYRHKDHDSMVFDSNGKWHWNSRNIKSASAIDLLIEYENKNFTEAILELSGESYATTYIESNVKRQDEAKKDFMLPAKNENHNRMFAYLTKTRKLDPDIVKRLFSLKLIYESKDYHNAVFVQRDVAGEIKGAFLRGTNSNMEKQFKGLSKGSDKNSSLFYFGNINNAKNIAVCEGAIDCISLASLWKQSENQVDKEMFSTTVFLATGGTGHENAVKFIQHNGENVDKILLCQDNDEAGNKFAEDLNKDLKTLDLSLDVERYNSIGKDFNEDLVKGLKPQQEQEAFLELEVLEM